MISVRSIEPSDRPWVVRQLENAFADVTVARKGILIDASVLPGFVASDGGRVVGLLTYYAAPSCGCEVVAIISTEEGRGIGQGLMDAARDYAEAAGYRRLWLITTNDNTRAIRFYQRWGMDLCGFYRHGVRRSRKVKPSIPERGTDGIPLEHELEFEMLLGGTVHSEAGRGVRSSYPGLLPEARSAWSRWAYKPFSDLYYLVRSQGNKELVPRLQTR
jgi:ribosomal protein S18 acetylase RimI-like enzyme